MDSIGSRIRSHPFGAVIFLAGFCGYGFGLLLPSLQVAVEGAQVVAGIVQYPPGNPFGMYLKNAWTILHQIGALGLRLGISERALCYLMGGLAGMVSFQALAACVYALSRSVVLAVLAPFCILFAADWSLGGLSYPGVTYGVLLAGSPHTYGMIGLSLLLLVLGSIASGALSFGGFLLGLLVSVHPGLGLWCHLVVLACVAADWRQLKGHLGGAVPYAALGYLITGFSLGYHLVAGRDPTLVSDPGLADYFIAFIRHWDFHRQPFSLVSSGAALAMVGLMMSLLWLGVASLREVIPGESLFLLRALVLCGILGAISSVSYWLPQNIVPQLLLRLMPGRLINVAVLGFPVLLIGLLGRYAAHRWVAINFVCLLVAILAATGMPRYGFMLPSALLLMLSAIVRKTSYGRSAFVGTSALLLFGGAVMLAIKSENPVFLGRYSAGRLLVGLLLVALGTALVAIAAAWGPRKSEAVPPISDAASDPLGRAVTLGLSLIAFATIARAVWGWELRHGTLADQTTDQLFATASQGTGLLLTSSDLNLVQLRTGRPIVLDGHALDALPYVLESGPEMSRILKRVYGVDFFDPPEAIKHARPGGLLPSSGRELWEARPPEEWAVIGNEYGATSVIAYADWTLRLPEAARNERFVLYDIPR